MKGIPGVVDWGSIKQRLLHGPMKLRPWEIMKMTMPEIVAALDEPEEGKQRPPTGSRPMSGEELQRWAAWIRGMTMAERIEAYQDGRL